MPSWYNLFFRDVRGGRATRWGNPSPLWRAGRNGRWDLVSVQASRAFFLAGAPVSSVCKPGNSPDSRHAHRLPLPAPVTAPAHRFADSGGLRLLCPPLRSGLAFTLVGCLHFVGRWCDRLALAIRDGTLRSPAPERLLALLRRGCRSRRGRYSLLISSRASSGGRLPCGVNGCSRGSVPAAVLRHMRPPGPYWVLAPAAGARLRPSPSRSTRVRSPAGAGGVCWRFALLRGVGAFLTAPLVRAPLAHSPRARWWRAVIAVPGSPKAGAERTSRCPLATVTAFASLIHFSFSAPIYFLYISPCCAAVVARCGQSADAGAACGRDWYSSALPVAAGPPGG